MSTALQQGAFTSHALMLNTEAKAALSCFHWMQRWEHRNCYARIFPSTPPGPPASIAKYVTKANGDWDVSDNLAGFRLQQPVLFGGKTASR